MKLVIVQARVGSTRLQNKVLLKLNGITVLEWLMKRLMYANMPDKFVIATTPRQEDNQIVDLCKKNRFEYFKGSEFDLLDRHYQCAKEYKADIVAKIPSDVPLIDPELFDIIFEKFYQGNYDYVSNLHPPTFPDGLDVEVFSFDALEKSWKEAKIPYEREHTTPYMWDNPDIFKIGSVTTDDVQNYFITHRWTIDYQEDYEFIKKVYETIGGNNPDFKWKELVMFLDEHPEIADINRHLSGINWYRNHIDELKTFDKSMTKLE